VVNGQIVDSVAFADDYFQNTLYQIAFIFTPNQSQISAFGELVVLNSDTSAITVNRFEVESAQQDAFYDNIVYSSEPSIRIVKPKSLALQESVDLAVQLIAGPLLPGWGAKTVLDSNVVTDLIAPFETTFTNLLPGEYSIDAFIIDGSGVEVPGDNAQDSVNTIGAGGRYYVAMGNSITKGLDDDDPSDDISLDGRNSGGGYEPILNDLLTAYEAIPHTIVNEGVPGDKSVDGRLIISDLLVKHPNASIFLVQYGTNDASVSSPTPSGLGLSSGDPGYPGTFKDNMQQVIDAIKAAGKDVYLAKSPIALAQCETCDPYPDPPTGQKNVLISEYNEVIDELVTDTSNGINIVPPDFFDYFSGVDLNTGRFRYEDQYATQLHPNGVGYDSMADLWFQAITP
jgi:lysophospholipase L1-like esterase